jgi:hypothetical protein
MTALDYSAANVPVREDLQAAHRLIWDYVRAPGNWWTGAERVAIAAEARRADACALCRDRKGALSPNAVSGEHAPGGALPANLVDVIHRIRTDPGRLSQPWFASVVAAGLEVPHYIELVAVVTMVTGVDYFCRSLGLAPLPLPPPLAGAPSRYLPAAAKPGTAWVPMIAPEDAGGSEADLYPPSPFIPNIVRALSLVPDAVRTMWRSSDAHYLPVAQIGDPSARRGALDRMQTELIAARVSAINQCFY